MVATTRRPLAYQRLLLVSMLSGVMSCASPPPRQTADDRAPGETAPLLKAEPRIAAGVRLIDCHYGRADPSAADIALQFMTGSPLLATKSTKGKYIVTFYGEAVQDAAADSVRAAVGTSATFIPLVAQCPPDMARIRAMQEDAGPPLAALPAARDLPAALLPPGDLQGSTLRAQRAVEQGEWSLSYAIRHVLVHQGDWIRRHIRLARDGVQNSAEIASGRAGYPAQRVVQFGETSLRILQDFTLRAAKAYAMTPPAVRQELSALLALQDELQSVLPAVRVIEAQQRESNSNAQRLAGATERAERRARSCRGLSTAAGAGDEPSEMEMCMALAASLRENAEGYEGSMDAMQKLFGQWVGDLTRHYGASLEAEIVGFRKRGPCSPDTDAGGRRGYVCPQQGDIRYGENRLLNALQQAGVPSMESESFYWKTGRWNVGLTKAQANAIRKFESAQADRDEKRRKTIEECRQQYLFSSQYWRCG